MRQAFLYIDPGTGSMLFSLFMALATTAVFVGRELLIRLKFILSGGRAKKADSKRIPYVIYSDHKRYWNVFKPVCDEFERRGIDVVYYTQSPDDPALSELYKHVRAEFIGEGNKGFARLNFLKTDVVLSTTPGLGVYQWKRSRDVKWYVHILHMASDPSTYRMFGLDCYDAVMLTGPYQEGQIRSLEEMRGIPAKELPVIGCTYMDTLKARLDAMHEYGRNESGDKRILLAPSWGSSGILSRYGGKIIDSLLATGYKLVVRPHPQSFTVEKPLLDKLMALYPDSDRLEWNMDNDNFSVLHASDILITDFSGIILDYALVFRKPVIYADTAFDPAPYDAAWISNPPWIFEILGKIGVRLDETDFPRMKVIIDSAIVSSTLDFGRDLVCSECWSNIGSSSSHAVDYLIAKQSSL